MSRPAGEALKEAGNRAKSAYARQKQLERLRKSWVAGSEMTAEQLAEIQPALKRGFYERETERNAA